MGFGLCDSCCGPSGSLTVIAAGLCGGQTITMGPTISISIEDPDGNEIGSVICYPTQQLVYINGTGDQYGNYRQYYPLYTSGCSLSVSPKKYGKYKVTVGYSEDSYVIPEAIFVNGGYQPRQVVKAPLAPDGLPNVEYGKKDNGDGDEGSGDGEGDTDDVYYVDVEPETKNSSGGWSLNAGPTIKSYYAEFGLNGVFDSYCYGTIATGGGRVPGTGFTYLFQGSFSKKPTNFETLWAIQGSQKNKVVGEPGPDGEDLPVIVRATTPYGLGYVWGTRVPGDGTYTFKYTQSFDVCDKGAITKIVTYNLKYNPNAYDPAQCQYDYTTKGSGDVSCWLYWLANYSQGFYLDGPDKPATYFSIYLNLNCPGPQDGLIQPYGPGGYAGFSDIRSYPYKWQAGTDAPCANPSGPHYPCSDVIGSPVCECVAQHTFYYLQDAGMSLTFKLCSMQVIPVPLVTSTFSQLYFTPGPTGPYPYTGGYLNAATGQVGSVPYLYQMASGPPPYIVDLPNSSNMCT